MVETKMYSEIEDFCYTLVCAACMVRYGSPLVLDDVCSGFPVLDMIFYKVGSGVWDYEAELSNLPQEERKVAEVVVPMIYQGRKPGEIIKKVQEIEGEDIYENLENWSTDLEKNENRKEFTQMVKEYCLEELDKILE